MTTSIMNIEQQQTIQNTDYPAINTGTVNMLLLFLPISSFVLVSSDVCSLCPYCGWAHACPFSRGIPSLQPLAPACVIKPVLVCASILGGVCQSINNVTLLRIENNYK